MSERIGEPESPPQTPDARLADALRPAVGAALRRSVRHEPGVWAEALFPVLLPAVRLAVTSALRDLVTTLNQVLEHSLSLQSWRWRLEAWRTGKSFAEIVLLRTLVYRVEQLLLVDRRTGLALASLARPDTKPKDTDLVSGMLTALQDFVADSFDIDRSAGIRELSVGDFTLLVESGPRAALAAAVRGHAPREFRETLRAAVDLIHQEFADQLRDFKGDPQLFEPSRTILEGCLQAQFHEPRSPSYTRLWLASAALLVLLAVWIGFRVERALRWDKAVAALRNTPGIAVTLAASQNGRYVLEGLRDPLAALPESVMANHRIDPREVSTRFQTYFSLDPNFLIRRVRVALGAPPTVSASLDRDVLTFQGTASHGWIVHARQAGPDLALAGIRSLRMGELVDSDLEASRIGIETTKILFPVNSSALTSEQNRLASGLAARGRKWRDDAASIGKTAQFEVLGYADQTGTEPQNLTLSKMRAARLVEYLRAEGIIIPPDAIRGEGPDTSRAEDPAGQRKAVLRLRLIQEVAPGRGTP